MINAGRYAAMKDNIIRTAVCPLCGRTYHGAPALSREDNKTLICPDCGTRQALQSIGVKPSEQEQILETIHRHMGRPGTLKISQNLCIIISCLRE